MTNQVNSKIDEFIAHGCIGLSNTGGLLVQINDEGDKVRLQYSDLTLSEWLDIEPGDEDTASFTEPNTDNVYTFNEIMKF